MNAGRFGLLFPLTALLACAGGSTMRVAQDTASDDAPVSLAPTPEAGPVDTTTQAPADTATKAPVTEPDSLSASPSEGKGYASYGSGEGLELRRIGQWTRTGVGESRRLVIRDANAWAEFWSELGVGDRPEVDFSQNVVVAVAAGQRPSGGYEIAVERIRQANGELTVDVVETAPGPNCMATGSSTQPVDIVVVPALAARSWSFVDRKEVRACR
jgi:protease stability complex PrcB-like protein